MRLTVTLGDITTERVDAIVNAANRGLAGGGGVDGAIHQAAGAAELRAACRPLAPCEVGEAKVTSGFRLPAPWIVHTVGPIWNGGHDGEAELLARCYVNCLRAADSVEAKSIAFPSISTGAYGYPPGEAARIAVDTVKAADTGVEKVRFVAFNDATFRIYRSILDKQGA